MQRERKVVNLTTSFSESLRKQEIRFQTTVSPRFKEKYAFRELELIECRWTEMARKRFQDTLLHLHGDHQQHHDDDVDAGVETYHQLCDAYCRVAKDSKAVAVQNGDQSVMFHGPIIVGAGPSGLAVAACLKDKGIPSMVIERSDCIASLWQLKTYDRLCLHLPKDFCELPLMPFPDDFPRYPTKNQFISYLKDYARRFEIKPVFNQTVSSAEYDDRTQLWRVKTLAKEYVCPWLVVATGENAEEVVPKLEGMAEFKGPIIHTSLFKSGKVFNGKKVLVVGCGNSGTDISLDLYNHNAQPYLVVRDGVHILPKEILGRSTFSLCMWLLKWFPLSAVDRFLLLICRILVGNTEQCGISRPELGPLTLKSLSGKTPVLDVGTLARIQSGDIKVRPGIKRLTRDGAEFVDGTVEDFDAIILATGYKSNVLSWLKDPEFFSDENGLPKRSFPNGCKGKRGLYAVGFAQRGLMGIRIDARRVANDIHQCWKFEGHAIHKPF